MRESKELYTSREEVELLLQQTRESDLKTKKKKRPGAGKLLWRALYLSLIAILLFALGNIWFARLNGNTPNLLGFQIYVVETGSMDPTLPIGSTIVVRALHTTEELKVGDVITFDHGANVVTHRVIELVTGADGVLRYQTKGDNPANSADPWLVERDQVHGKMIWHFAW